MASARYDMNSKRFATYVGGYPIHEGMLSELDTIRALCDHYGWSFLDRHEELSKKLNVQSDVTPVDVIKDTDMMLEVTRFY